MYSKISLDAGHNAYPDTGANALKFEDNLTKDVVSLVIPRLQKLGIEAVDCSPYNKTFSSVGESLAYRCELANNSRSQLHLCIHFNCGGGHGVEVYAMSATGKEVAQRVCDDISILGYTNRGVKDGSNLYVLKNTNMPAILIECAFVDSTEDMGRYNAEDLANAIVRGVTGQVIQSSTLVQEPKLVEVPRYDESIPAGVFQIPGTKFYIEPRTDGGMGIHTDRGNYIVIGKGFTDAYWNNNNGQGGSKRISG